MARHGLPQPFASFSVGAGPTRALECAPCTHGRRLATRTSPRASTTCSSRLAVTSPSRTRATPAASPTASTRSDERSGPRRPPARRARGDGARARDLPRGHRPLPPEERGRVRQAARSARRALGERRRPRDARSRSSPRSRRLQSTGISRARATRRPRSSSSAEGGAHEEESRPRSSSSCGSPTRTQPTSRCARSSTDADLGDTYRAFVGETQRFFKDEAPFGPKGESLLDLLLAPSRAAPGSILDQLKYIEDELGPRRSASTSSRSGDACCGRRTSSTRRASTSIMAVPVRARRSSTRCASSVRTTGRGAEALQRRPRLDAARRASSRRRSSSGSISSRRSTARRIERLDQIPDEELDLLASRGFTGLWLIGLFERSTASKHIKQHARRPGRGRVGVLADEVRHRRGSSAATRPTRTCKYRAWQRGLRLAADMVPNHVGIDAEWVDEPPGLVHPDAARRRSPATASAARTSRTTRASASFIEEGYWNKTRRRRRLPSPRSPHRPGPLHLPRQRRHQHAVERHRAARLHEGRGPPRGHRDHPPRRAHVPDHPLRRGDDAREAPLLSASGSRSPAAAARSRRAPTTR